MTVSSQCKPAPVNAIYCGYCKEEECFIDDELVCAGEKSEIVECSTEQRMAFAVSFIALAVFTAFTVIVFLYPDISEITDDMFLKVTDCDYSKVFTEYVKRINDVFR